MIMKIWMEEIFTAIVLFGLMYLAAVVILSLYIIERVYIMKELGNNKKNKKKRQRKCKNAHGSFFVWNKNTSRLKSLKKSLRNK